MNILIACDKYKGSLDAKGVCMAIQKGIQQKYPYAQISSLPMADGGDGTIEILKQVLEGESKIVNTLDPCNRELQAEYFTTKDTAYLELALASGISLLHDSEKNPGERTTLGTGLLARQAIEAGYKNIVFCLGGSCTNDGGIGILQGLGFKFYNSKKNELEAIGKNLIHIDSFSKPQIPSTIHFKVLSDITNPLYGPQGAAHIFARQKGADDKMIAELDLGLRHFSQIVNKEIGIDISTISGGGSAGGIAAGLYGCLNAEVVSGFEYLKEKTELERKIKSADLVITGEGRLDHTSMGGKLIGGLATLCSKNSRPLYALVGDCDFNTQEIADYGFEEVKTVISIEPNLSKAMSNTEELIMQLSQTLDLV